MAFAYAQGVDASHSTFNEVGHNQYNITNNFNVSDEVRIEQALRKLKPVEMNSADRSPCLPGTRLDIIEFIINWATNPSTDHSMLWIHGLAGSGKSTLSTTVANYFLERGCLGAFLFFNRDFGERNQPSAVFRTMAYQLGTFNREIGVAISNAISDTPSIAMSPYLLQCQKLILEPIRVHRTKLPLVILLDALDECGNARERRDLLSVLAEESIHIPSHVRIVVTSREEFDISGAFLDQPRILVRELDITSRVNASDIALYVDHRMVVIRRIKRHLRLGEDWPGKDQIRQLIERAFGLFVWAATALDFIDAHDPRKRLAILLEAELSSAAESAVDNLYRTALESVGMWDDEDFVADFHIILGTILVARQPLSSSAIDDLLGLHPDRPSIHTISLLGCVLRQGPTVRILHPSFADFLSQQSRCGSDVWFIDPATHSLRVATSCLDRLDGILKQNICDLTLSPQNIVTNLSEDISYACIFWIEHVCSTTDVNTSLLERLDNFLHRHLLHWFEAMSILRRSRDIIGLLSRLYSWISAHSSDHGRLIALVHDACRFVQAFGSSLEDHPLLVYMTALPFAPTKSTLYQTFNDDDSIPQIAGGFASSWSPLLLILSGHDEAVTSSAFSPDGTKVVSGSEDTTIRVWDVMSGAQLLEPLRAHQHVVLSVAFSSDGKRIVSGSSDRTIRLWDTFSGHEVIPPLQGHRYSVTSAVFSPDDARIVSGSEDKTVRVWDAALGQEVFPPLRGHSDTILSVATSPDGSLIISGSVDGTIRVWNAASGIAVLQPLQWEPVYSVAVSANGNKIVTGSERGNVCLWDSATGEKISSMPLSEPGIAAVAISLEGQRIAFGSWDNTIQLWDLSCDKALLPLRGHEDEITSVAFSPDGRRIVSSSSDKTVRLWDAGSAVEGIPSLQGPKLKSWALSTDDVVPLVDDATRPGDGCPSLPWRESSNLPLAFSSDGTWIASGSFDQSIRLWDAASGTELLSPLRGHRDYVISLAFSQDRKYIASGSFDKDVRVWNTTNRKTLPLVGHKGSVLAVAFSPDGRQVVSGSSDNTIMVWFAFTGTQSLPPLQGHQKTITAVVFSPDGKRIISGSEDKTIRVWDAKLGTEILPPLRGHSGPISSVAFSHGGRVISGSFDNTIRLWDISSGHYDRLEVSIHSNHKFGHHIVLTTDGWIVCLTGTGCTYLSKLPSMVLIDSVAASVSSLSSITIGTFSGELFIMHFPSGL